MERTSVLCCGETMAEISPEAAASGRAKVGFAGAALSTGICLQRSAPDPEIAAGPRALHRKAFDEFDRAQAVLDGFYARESLRAAYLAESLAGHNEKRCVQAGCNLAARVIGARQAILPCHPQGAA